MVQVKDKKPALAEFMKKFVLVTLASAPPSVKAELELAAGIPARPGDSQLFSGKRNSLFNAIWDHLICRSISSHAISHSAAEYYSSRREMPRRCQRGGRPPPGPSGPEA